MWLHIVVTPREEALGCPCTDYSTNDDDDDDRDGDSLQNIGNYLHLLIAAGLRSLHCIVTTKYFKSSLTCYLFSNLRI
jgi:hypothetical protein